MTTAKQKVERANALRIEACMASKAEKDFWKRFDELADAKRKAEQALIDEGPAYLNLWRVAYEEYQAALDRAKAVESSGRTRDVWHHAHRQAVNALIKEAGLVSELGDD